MNILFERSRPSSKPFQVLPHFFQAWLHPLPSGRDVLAVLFVPRISKSPRITGFMLKLIMPWKMCSIITTIGEYIGRLAGCRRKDNELRYVTFCAVCRVAMMGAEDDAQKVQGYNATITFFTP
jgi:hypothetical protein